MTNENSGETMNIRLFEFDNSYFGSYNVLAEILEKDIERLSQRFGQEIRDAFKWKSEKGGVLEPKKVVGVRYYLLETSKKWITPVRSPSYLFGGQYDEIPVGKELIEESIDILGYCFKSKTVNDYFYSLPFGERSWEYAYQKWESE